jgi:acetyltransferase
MARKVKSAALDTGGHHPDAAKEVVLLDGSRLFVRSVCPADGVLFQRFIERITPNDLRLRFFAPVKFGPTFVTRLINFDPAQAAVFMALDDSNEIAGVVGLHLDGRGHGEYAVLVRSALKGRGLGWALMKLIIEHARDRGLRQLTGQILHENVMMLQMCRELGFRVKPDPLERTVDLVTLDLDARPAYPVSRPVSSRRPDQLSR